MPYVDADKLFERLSKAEIEEDYKKHTEMTPMIENHKQLKPLNELKEDNNVKGKPRDYNKVVETLINSNINFSKKTIFDELEIAELMRTESNFMYYMKNIRAVAKEKGFAIKTHSRGEYILVPLKGENTLVPLKVENAKSIVFTNNTINNDFESHKTVKEEQQYEVKEIVNDLGKVDEVKLGGDPSPKIDRLELNDILKQIEGSPKLIETFNLVLEPLGWKAITRLDLIKI